MFIIRTKKDLAAYVAKLPAVLEVKRVSEEDETEEEFEDILSELVKLLAVGDNSPDFGEDWEAYLADNIEMQLEEAISIVM